MKILKYIIDFWKENLKTVLAYIGVIISILAIIADCLILIAAIAFKHYLLILVVIVIVIVIAPLMYYSIDVISDMTY